MSDESPNPYALTFAQLQWQSGDVPFASGYEDIYFSRQQGLEETRHVFLHHNRLPSRWRQLAETADRAGVFTIGETGFGTGLNFLAAWQLWRETAPKHWRLHFISTEKHPLRNDDLKRSLSPWTALQPLAEQLLAQYPVLVPGHHCLSFDNGAVTLHLLLGDATDSLTQLCRGTEPNSGWRVDAWFLDGFAPARNPSLWHDDLYRQLARLSAPGTTIATFTAVGDVRRGLARAGFAMAKTKGFGSKRDMLSGVFQALPSDTPQKSHDIPWFWSEQFSSTPRHVAVIGAGLAGAHTAHALARRGMRVTVIDAAPSVASGASGNPQGMLYTKLSPQAGLLNQFTLGSFLHALRHYRQLCQGWQEPPLQFCGVLQLAVNDKDQRLLQALQATFRELPELVRFVDATGASALAGITLRHPGWFYPAAGWVSPPALCQRLLEDEAIDLRLNQAVAQLHRSQDHWQLRDADGATLTTADAVVIANSRDAARFNQCRQLPLKTIRGQITGIAATPYSSNLKTVICHDGYLTPAVDGRHHLGATFDLDDSHTEVRAQDHHRNLGSLAMAIPDLFPADSELTGRAALRCTSPDYLPMAGPVPVHEDFLRDYAPLRKNARQPIPIPGSYYPGLYINVAHGSRGLTSTPLCAELIAAQLTGEPLPVSRALLHALHPARFIIRDLMRNKI